MTTRKTFDRGNRLQERMESLQIEDNDRALSTTNKIHHLLIDKIIENPHQPRLNIEQEELEELKSSIEQYGLIQPITVAKQNNGYFIVVAGHRRLEAHRQLGSETIEAIITEKSDTELKYLVLLENLQRKDLDPLELSLTYNSLLADADLTQEELAKKVSKSQSHISRVLNLLKLSDAVQEEIRSKRYTNIKVLNALNTVEKTRQKELLNEIKELNTEDALRVIKESQQLEREEEKPQESSFQFNSDKDETKFTIKLDINAMSQEEKEEAIKKLETIIQKLDN